MSHHKLTVGDIGVFCRGTLEDCQRQMKSLKEAKSGHKKESTVSSKAMSIDIDPADYPYTAKPIVLGYVPSSQVKK